MELPEAPQSPSPALQADEPWLGYISAYDRAWHGPSWLSLPTPRTLVILGEGC